MLDLGFIEDVERILRMCPSGRQTLLFSATMPEPVARLAEQYMYDPVTIRVTPKKLTVDSVEQAYVMVEPRKKLERLADVLKAEEPEQAIIFVRTKIGAARLGRDLADKGLRVKALHGDLSQGQRDGVMISFKEHKTPLLVATDIAARGLDIEHVTHVINYDFPNNPEIYVHRIGRTGRVGRTGRAITFVTSKQKGELKEVERVVKAHIGEWEPPEERLEHAPTPRHHEGPPPKAPNGSVKLFVNRGKRGGISEEDLSWALREGAVLPEDAIHSIRVMDRFSFVEVAADQAERAVEYLDGTKLKGKQIRMEIARS
jgi:ATP-dependent RNA helicase DeaD